LGEELPELECKDNAFMDNNTIVKRITSVERLDFYRFRISKLYFLFFLFILFQACGNKGNSELIVAI